MSTVAFDFKALADTARDALLADPFFATIPAVSGAAVVVSEDPEDINTAITNALNDIGLGVMVMLPEGTVGDPNVPGPYFDDIRLVVMISETPTINRPAGMPATLTSYSAAMNVCRILHRYAPPSINEVFSVAYCVPVKGTGFNTWNVGLKTQAGLDFQITPLAPLIGSPTTAGNQTVTFSCATPGAAIFYTLDGTYPSPRTCTLYTTPVAVAAGQQLRARAWLAGFAPSTPIDFSVIY